MSHFPALLSNLFRNLFRRRAVDADLNDELDSYVDLVAHEKMAAGLSPEEARRAARMELGGKAAVRDEVKRATAGAGLHQLAQDLRYASRTLRRQPGFLLVAVATIALGIGMNASIFSILNSLLMRPLPAPDPGRLVSLYQKLDGAKDRSFYGGLYRFSLPEYQAFRDNNRVLSGLAAYSPELRVLVDDNAQQTEGQAVSCNYFGVLETPMALGRGFSERECDGDDAPGLVVLGNDFWQRQYKGDAAIVGKTIRMNRVPVTVIGVAAPGAAGTDVVPAGFWAPLPMIGKLGGHAMFKFDAKNLSWLELIGRRRDAVTMAEVRANLELISHQLDKQRPGVTSQLTVSTATLLGAPNRRTAVMAAGAVVLIAVGMVLMIACANLANLMLARAIARGKEIAMRLALGASRGRIVRQLLTEALLIAAVGGAAGASLAWFSGAILFRELVAHLPDGAPMIQVPVQADFRVVLYAFGLTMLTGVAFGLMPALRATRPELNNLIKQEGAGMSHGRQGGRGRSVLVGSQVAFCMVLLLASGLLLRALLRAQTVDPGFDMKNVAVLTFDVARVGYNNAQTAAFNSDLMDRVQATPGVESAVLSGGSPLGDRHFVTGFVSPATRHEEGIPYFEVTPGLFSMLRIPVLRGRDFSNADVARGGNEVIVSQSLAQSFFPGQDPIGKTFNQGGPDKPVSMQVIGVVRDAEVSELGDRDKRFVYMLPKKDDAAMMQTVLVRYGGDFASMSKLLQADARAIDPALKVSVARLEDNLGPYQAICRLTAGVATTLGLLALVLAMIGLYGTVSYGVNCRKHEIGVRMALGATGSHVLKLLTRQAMRPVVIGAVAGIALCAAVSRVLAGMLFGVSPHDAVTFTGVPLLLIGIALAAALIPARRALTVNPAVALRNN